MSPTSLPAGRSKRERIRWRLFASLKDLISFTLAGLLAFELRFDGAVPTKYHHSFVVALIVWATAKTIAFIVGGVNRGFWRYTSIYDAQRIAIANSAGSVVGAATLIVVTGPMGDSALRLHPRMDHLLFSSAGRKICQSRNCCRKEYSLGGW